MDPQPRRGLDCEVSPGSLSAHFMKSPVVRRLTAFGLVVCSCAPAALFAQSLGRAPDGELGFGDALTRRDASVLFRAPDEAQALNLMELLRSLPSDVNVLLACANATYRARGYHQILDHRLGELSEVYEAFHALDSAPFGRDWDESAALAFARMLADPRLRPRESLIQAAREELDELRDALRLFEVHSRGQASLDDDEVRRVAARADLAAARLRTVRRDLERLYESPANALATSDSLEILRAAQALASDDPKRSRNLSALRAQARTRSNDLQRGSALADFDLRHHKLLSERRDARRQANELLGEALVHLPIPTPGVMPDPKIEAMGHADRYKAARRISEQGCSLDPLNANLNYTLGLACEFASEKRASLTLFDRYLALRGIRHWEHTTFRDRPLSELEQYALEVVTGWRPERKKER